MPHEKRLRIHPVILQRSRDMRHPLTAAEATLWHTLRNRHHGYKFRRQHPIGPFIVDFYCAQVKLCIEVDGPSHFEPGQQEYDAARTLYLETLGNHVLRCTNDDIRYNLNGVLVEIENVIHDLEINRQRSYTAMIE